MLRGERDIKSCPQAHNIHRKGEEYRAWRLTRTDLGVYTKENIRNMLRQRGFAPSSESPIIMAPLLMMGSMVVEAMALQKVIPPLPVFV